MELALLTMEDCSRWASSPERKPSPYVGPTTKSTVAFRRLQRTFLGGLLTDFSTLGKNDSLGWMETEGGTPAVPLPG